MTWQASIKRSLDVGLASLVLILAAPLMAVLAAAVWVSEGRPILFRHDRAGQAGRRFTFYKFRTMREGRGNDAERLTLLGRFLRASSLDELPQLWNVLRGDMSLVGPRPLLADYLELYDGFQKRRHEVRPGITGWAQIHGRNALSWEEKFDLDVWYVDHASLWLDSKILLRTFWQVVCRRGISQPGHATMRRFEGRAGHRIESGWGRS